MRDKPLSVHVRRPFAGLTLAFIVGCFFGDHAGSFIPVAALCGLFCGLTVLLAKSPLSTITLLLACALLGCLRMHGYQAGGLIDSLHQHLFRPRQSIELIAQVSDSPQVFFDVNGRAAKVRFQGRVKAVRGHGSFQPCHGVVSVEMARSSSTGRLPKVNYGQQWRLCGVIDREPTVYTWLGPAHRLRVAASDAFCISEHGGFRFARWCLELRDRCAAQLSRGVGTGAPETKFIKALLLGYRSDLDEPLRDAFAATGTLHVLAVSGLHVGILVYLLMVILQAAGVARYRCGALLIPILMGYAVMTGLRPSAVRACIMTGILLIGVALRRRSDALTALAFAASAMLFVHPGQLHDVGFLFSFLAVLALIVIAPRLTKIVENCGPTKEETDQWSLEPVSRWVRARHWIRRWGWGMVGASVAVWLVTTPLTINFFHICSPVVIIGNLLVIPIAFLAVFTALCSLIFGLIHPLFSEIFNFANVVFIRILLGWVRILMHIPGGHFRIAVWPIWAMIVWYALLFLSLVSRQYLRKVVFSAMLLALLGGAAGFAREWRFTDVVVMRPPESGVVLIRGPRGLNVVVNAGPAYLARTTLRNLRRLGVERINVLILARAESEYVGAAPELFRTIPVQEVWCGPNGILSPSTLNVLREARKMGIRIRRVAAPRVLSLGELQFEFFSPSGAVRPRDAGKSIVFRLQRGQSAMLYAAGMTPATERILLSLPVDFAATLLILGGRDIRNCYSSTWLASVRPENIVINMGSDGTWIEPPAEAVNRLLSCGARLWRSDRDGETVWRMQPDGKRDGRAWQIVRSASTEPCELL